MSETQSRPATRGRSSARGGRGGHGGRNSSSRYANGSTKSSSQTDSSADDAELAELKKQNPEWSTLKELFPDWSDLDLIVALQDSGDLQTAIDRISEGHISQFAEIHHKSKDRSRSKVKDVQLSDSAPTRGGRRGRGGFESSRAARGGTERGRGGHRGPRGGPAAANGTRGATAPTSVPTTESSAWDTPGTDNKENTEWEKPTADTGEHGAEGQWGSVITSGATPATTSEGQKSSLIPEGGVKKTWASMFAKPKPAPAPPKPVAEPVAPPVPEPAVEVPAPEEPAKEEPVPASEDFPIPPVADEVPVEKPESAPNTSNHTPDEGHDTPALEITPSIDELTEDNVEHLPDASQPAPTGTAASTVASSAGTPSGIAHQAPISRPLMGGYATTAFKATATPGRSASFQRRILEQQEAVVLPGNHAVDRAAVQFGSMGLNGDEAEALDVDEDREEAETRTQPPTHSPTAQPRAALPPAPRQPSGPADVPAVEEGLPAPKQAPGLPPVSQQQQQPIGQQSPQNTLAAQGMSQQGSQGAQQYNQFGRYGMPSETSIPAQKPYDPFGQQVSQPSQFDNYPAQSQVPGQPQQAQSQLGGYSSAPTDQSSYYTSEQQRNAYQNYYSGYGQQSAATQQDAGASQQRTGSAFGAASAESNYPTSQSQTTQGRYGEAQGSGHTTPNPIMGQQPHTGAQSQQGQPMHHHGQSTHGAGYPYNGGHPYYNSPYYTQYMANYGYNQQGYGGPYGKAGIYGQPQHGFGMSPQTSYDQHSSSPANAGAFGRDSGLGGGLGDYGRAGSTQPGQSQQQGSSSGAFGGMPDVFGRSPSGFPGQGQGYGSQQSAQQGAGDDALKTYDSKANVGPSPSALSQPGRPGSATNPAAGQSAQSGLPPPQSQHQGFGGGYPNHLNQLQGQGSQYGGLGGLGGNQGGHSQHAGGYGNYGGFGQYGNYGRGGWGGNYGH